MSTVRVRFAPSPTGHLHIGGLRTALFNWLFAQHYKGSFLLRIEDTDVQRSRTEYVDSIMQALAWVNIVADEMVIFQSERMGGYARYAHQLLEEGKAYRCYCPPAEDRVGQDYLKYDGQCRAHASPFAKPGQPYIIRFKFPLERETIQFNDLIKGTISYPADQFDDFILMRSDGMPMYNFAVVVDDAMMGITHVIRGEDHIPNTPKQLLLYEALGLSVPYFAHIPLILGPSGARLSKREGATSVLEYKEQGFLPDALCNYLVRLGWAHKDQEIFSREEMISLFSLENVNPSNAIFDQKKLAWMNSVYIKAMASKEIFSYIDKHLDASFKNLFANEEGAVQWIDVFKERVQTLVELIAVITAVKQYVPSLSEQERSVWQLQKELVKALQLCVDGSKKLKVLDKEALEMLLQDICQQTGLKFVDISKALRMALIGFSQGPGIYALCLLFGKQEFEARVNKFIEYIQ